MEKPPARSGRDRDDGSGEFRMAAAAELAGLFMPREQRATLTHSEPAKPGGVKRGEESEIG